MARDCSGQENRTNARSRPDRCSLYNCRRSVWSVSTRTRTGDPCHPGSDRATPDRHKNRVPCHPPHGHRREDGLSVDQTAGDGRGCPPSERPWTRPADPDRPWLAPRPGMYLRRTFHRATDRPAAGPRRRGAAASTNPPSGCRISRLAACGATICPNPRRIDRFRSESATFEAKPRDFDAKEAETHENRVFSSFFGSPTHDPG
jgi:hypothetical protein